jgi:hypothetical protein
MAKRKTKTIYVENPYTGDLDRKVVTTGCTIPFVVICGGIVGLVALLGRYV